MKIIYIDFTSGDIYDAKGAPFANQNQLISYLENTEDYEILYVTDGGSRYHNTVSCSGLRRTIESVTLMQALEMGRHACPRCG